MSETTSRQKKHKEALLSRMLSPKAGSDPWITAAVLVLMAFGTVMVVSTNLGTTLGRTQALYTVIIKQAAFAVLAWEIGVVFISRFFHYRIARSLQWLIFGAYLVLLLMTAVFGTDVNGSKAWLQFGTFFSLQPSEFGKPLLIMTLALSAGSIRHLPKEKQTFFTIFRLPLLQMALSIVFLGALQKDFGSLIITLGIGLAGMLIPSWNTIEGWQKGIFYAFLGGMALLLIGVYLTNLFVEMFSNVPILRHIAIRIENMHDPYLSIHNEGYQPANALYGIADSGLFGRGLGSSVRKYGFLTQAESDYILAIVIEETGIIGLGLITVCYVILLWRLMHWALRAKRVADKVLFTCSAAYLMLHFFINIGGVSTLIPMTGVPLLFISAGGSALIAVCICIGMVQARVAAVRKAEREIRRRKAGRLPVKTGQPVQA